MPENTSTVIDTDELRDLVANALELPREQVTDRANFADDLLVDSLMALEIVVKLEKRYQIKILESDFKQLTTLLDVHGLVEAKLKDKADA